MRRDEIKNTQPIFYRVIEKSFTRKTMSHAYLLVGEQSDDVALYLAQSLICQHDILACEVCDECVRIEKQIYPDMIVYDGNEASIKKDNIDYIQREFSKSSYENKGKIYLLKNVEKSSTVAMNALLKFLEEPADDVFAILTTRNLNKVLPTIQSRCQVIQLLSQSKDVLKTSLMKHFTQEDANVLSSLFTNSEEALAYGESEQYQTFKVNTFDFIEDLYRHPDNLMFNQELHIGREYKSDKAGFVRYLNMLVMGLRDLLHVKHSLPLTYCEHQDFFDKLPNDDKILERIEIILDTIYYVDINANTQLLLDRMIYKILGGK